MNTCDRGGWGRWPREYAMAIAPRPRQEWAEALQAVPEPLREMTRDHLRRIVALGQRDLLFPKPPPEE